MILTTDRLTLRPIALEDWPGFEAFVASDRSRFMGGPGTDRDVIWRAFAHLAGLWHLKGYGPFAVQEEGRTIGLAGAWEPLGIPEPEMSWAIWNAADEGRGLMAEAVRACLDHVWNTLRLPSLVSYIDPANLPSVRLAERLGARREPEAPTPEDGVMAWRHPGPRSEDVAA